MTNSINQTASIMFTDIVGYSAMISKDQKHALDLLAHHDKILEPIIDKKGTGMHHIAFLVDHLQPALDYLKDQGVHLIDEKPRIGAEGLSIAFLHPKSTSGILVELCEKEDV